MKKLLITGAKERENGFELGDGKFYDTALLMRLDLISGESETLLSIDQGNEHYPSIHPNIQFTAGQVINGQLWLPTDTEIRVYSYPELMLERIISHPFFHNVHSVHFFDGDIVVSNTGLDMVAVLDFDTGDVKKLYNVEGKDIWHRFSQDKDYRIIHSTRPHDAHPNYIFKLDDELWVTRCIQEDAVCLSDIKQRIEVSGERNISIHDGHLVDGKIYFTSVDGCVVIVDPNTKKVIETINLYDMDDGKHAKGWCRGIWIDGDLIHVAFSKLRKTRTQSRLQWLSIFHKSLAPTCSIIATYNLKLRKKVNEYSLPEGSIDAIYSVFAEPA